jgi:hypothetical protein
MKNWLIASLVWVLPMALLHSPECAAQSAGLPGTVFYNPVPSQPFRLLVDYYHHGFPSTKIGNYIITGGWADNKGRYGLDDFGHPNTLDPVYIALEKEYLMSMSTVPYTKEVVSKVEGIVIPSVDSPRMIPGANVLSDPEIAVLQEFVRNGGSLMLMLNAGGDSRVSESFESVQLKKLVSGFGLGWNNDDTHYSDVEIPDGHPYFYDIPIFHYGAGCTLNILPNAIKPEILLNVASHKGYTDRSVNGPGIVLVRPGKGKFILVGDAGSWTGNIARPWAENERLLKQLFRFMKPDKGVTPFKYTLNTPQTYEMTMAGIQEVPVANSLSELTRPFYRSYSPRAITGLPYIEASATVEVVPKVQTETKAFKTEASVKDFKWFDESPKPDGFQTINFDISRQGKVSGINAKGFYARWLAPDISILSALLAVDGLRPGDRWESVETVRIPAIRGADLSAIRPLNMDFVYVDDVTMESKRCRLVRSSGEMWLSDLDVKIEDLFPEEEVKQIGGLNYEYLKERGGKLLFKREQWVEVATGIVVQAKLQTRLISWIHDIRKPVPPTIADWDNQMLVLLAHMTTFKLKK